MRWLEDLLRDLRHGGRGLLRSPGFTLAAVGVLAVGIGATTAVFSAVHTVLRNPAHDEMAVIFYRGFPSLSTVDFRALEEQQRSFAAVGGMRGGEAAFRARGEPELVRVGRVTSGFFAVLQLRAQAGRLLEPRDNVVGAEPVAVIGHNLAARSFGDAAAALGEAVTIDGVAHTIVGVLTPSTELLANRAEVWPALQLAEPTRRGPFGMLVIARLAEGATFESAAREVAGISERVAAIWSPGRTDPTARYDAIPIRTALLTNSSRMLRIFGIAAALVLLIGIANVASLMLVRAIGRSQEVSLRATLGASRAQLVRLFVAESALLSVAGAIAGITLGALILRALVAAGPRLPGLTVASLDIRASIFAVALALLAGLAVGSYPVVLLFRRQSLEAGAGHRLIGGGRGTRAVRSAFVVTQFALALPLLAVSALLLVSFMRMQRVDAGFDAHNLLTVRVPLPAGQYGNDTLIAEYWARALPRIGEVPGIAHVGLGSSLPPNDFGNSNNNFDLIDRPVAPDTPEPNAPWPSANAEFFAALGVPLLEGRLYTPADSAAQVVLVSRSWAKKHYPGESPLGKAMVRGGCTECPPTVVIGVVDDVRYSGLAGPLDAMYSPLIRQWPRTLYLFIRTNAPAQQLVAPVREALRSVDASVPLADIATMEERLYTTIAQPRQWATLVAVFAAAALALAAIGVFGMLSYMVNTRRREIGVRLALGAAPGSVVRMFVGNGFAHAVAGSVLGLAIALAGTRALATMLFDVTAQDPRTLALATSALLAVAVIACWLPARRAAAIEPLEAIRHE